jgi:histidinol dehydrogenase
VNDFVKLITVQEYSAQALSVLGPKAALLADAEGLSAHAESIRTRLAKSPRSSNPVRSRQRRSRA